GGGGAAFGGAGWGVAALGHARRWADVGPELAPPARWIEGDGDGERLAPAPGALGPPEGLFPAAARDSVGQPQVLFHAAGGGSVGASLADPLADHARTVGSLAQTLAFLEAQ